MSITFTGSALTWIAKTGPFCGTATVTLDGATTVLVDLYSRRTGYQRAVYSTGTLAAGPHTIQITGDSQRNRRSRGYEVNLDAVDVAETVPAPVDSPSPAATTSTTVPAQPTTTTTTVAPTTTTVAPTTTTTTAPTTSTTAAPTTTTTAKPPPRPRSLNRPPLRPPHRP